MKKRRRKGKPARNREKPKGIKIVCQMCRSVKVISPGTFNLHEAPRCERCGESSWGDIPMDALQALDGTPLIGADFPAPIAFGKRRAD